MRALISSLSMRTSIIAVLMMFCLMLLAGAGMGLVPLSMNNRDYTNNASLAAQADQSHAIAEHLVRAQSAFAAADRLHIQLLGQLQKGEAADGPSWSAQIEPLYDQVRTALGSFSQTAPSGAEKNQVMAAWQQVDRTGLSATLAALAVADWQAYPAALQQLHSGLSVLQQASAPWLERSRQQASLVTKQTESSAERAISLYKLIVAGVLLGCVMATGLTLATYFYLNRQVLLPIRLALEQIEATAHGDLTTPIHVVSRNELGLLSASLRRMQNNLTSIVKTVRSGVDEIHVGSSEIAQGNLDLSARTERQAAFIEQTTSSMAELASRVQANASSAQQANQQSAQSMNVAQRGGTVMAQVVETMQNISTSSHKISEIVGVIDGIAFQTNILALNAAVEAARAGEAGRGFAVVAGEVRALAQKSAQAAKEIKGLIASSVEQVQHGSAHVSNAGETMREIVDAVGRVTIIMREISQASTEQSAGIEQINHAISDMDQGTQQNAALVEQAAAAASSLQEQAHQLADAVAVFKIHTPGEVLEHDEQGTTQAPKDATRQPSESDFHA
jgi:methyl-accepting chemotaxis protein-1 (serine sensor receptor)